MAEKNLEKKLNEITESLTNKTVKKLVDLRNIARKSINVIVKESLVKDGLLNTEFIDNYFKDNERLVLEEGVYTLGDLLFVPRGRTLEIAPGTKVICQATQDMEKIPSISSVGVLFAMGKPFKKIKFEVGFNPTESGHLVRISDDGSKGSKISHTKFLGRFQSIEIDYHLLGIYNTTADIYDCIFTYNSPNQSEHYSCGGIAIRNSNIRIQGNTINDCKSQGGSGIDIACSEVLIRDNTITNCQSLFCAGGIEIYDSKGEIIDNQINHCLSDYSAGGVSIKGSNDIILEDNKIIQNATERGLITDISTGLYLEKSNINWQNNNIVNNKKNNVCTTIDGKYTVLKK